MSEICTLLAWDSKHWGFPVARVDQSELTEDAVREVIRWCEDKRVRCLYFAADATCADTLQLVWSNGFCFVDVRVDMEKGFPDDAPDLAENVACREAKSEDLPVLEQLARTAHEDTRFFKDGNFDREKTADLYALWIARDFRENKVFVARSADAPKSVVGYISASARSGEVGRIGLVAVSPEARGRGLGQALVKHAVAWCRAQGAGSVNVATQVTNVAALRLYETCAFKAADVKVWFHRWFNK